jgi:hypothetical protein
MDETAWENYGHASENPKCANCMVHSGYEASAVDHTFSSFGGLFSTAKAILFNAYANPSAGERLADEAKKPHGPAKHLVQLGLAEDVETADGKRTYRLKQAVAS